MSRINLSEVAPGRKVHVLAGEGDYVNEYDFDIVIPGEHPVCNFTQRSWYDDETWLGPMRVLLEGCLEGDHPPYANLSEELYDKLEQNLMPGDGSLKVGGIMVISAVDRKSEGIVRRVVLPPISALTLEHAVNLQVATSTTPT